MAKGDYTDSNTKARYRTLVKKPSSTPAKVTIASDELRTRAEILDMVEELFESEKDVGGGTELNPQIDNESLRAFLHMLSKNVVNTSDDGAGITTSQANAITSNTAKTGITSSQASAITANTAKTGITTSQADAIVANTAKTGISTSQASAITANTAKVSQGLATANHTMQFDVANDGRGNYILRITIIDGTNAKLPVTKTVDLTLR